jgi:hypothetical protein
MYKFTNYSALVDLDNLILLSLSQIKIPGFLFQNIGRVSRVFFNFVNILL